MKKKSLFISIIAIILSICLTLFCGCATDGVDGKDGNDGKDADIYSAYTKAVELNQFSGTFFEFLKEVYNMPSSTDDVTLSTNVGLRSVVSVYATFTVTTSFMGKTTTSEEQSGGAGVIYKMESGGNAYIITNYHVIYNANSSTENKISNNIFVLLYGMEYTEYQIPATYVGGSINYDIAVLKVTNDTILKNSSAIPATVKSSSTIVVGQTVIAIGNPAGCGISATTGSISVESESIKLAIDSIVRSYRSIRVDCAVNSGNSGGGLFNANGELIGIVNAKTSDTSIEGMAYAIPSDIAIRVAQNIIDNDGTLQKCKLGIVPEISNVKTEYVDGHVVVTEKIKIEKFTSTFTSSTLAVGDVIDSVELNGTTHLITSDYMLTEILFDARVNDTVTINYTRDNIGKTAQFTFTSDCVSKIA